MRKPDRFTLTTNVSLRKDKWRVFCWYYGISAWCRRLMQMKKNILKLQGKIAQLKEVLENRENKIQELQKELSICQKNSGQVHNARGAGRKKMNKEMRDRLALFDKLLGEGHPMSEIMGKMGISKATYFRYLKISRQGEENLGGMGSPWCKPLCFLQWRHLSYFCYRKWHHCGKRWFSHLHPDWLRGYFQEICQKR